MRLCSAGSNIFSKAQHVAIWIDRIEFPHAVRLCFRVPRHLSSVGQEFCAQLIDCAHLEIRIPTVLDGLAWLRNAALEVETDTITPNNSENWWLVCAIRNLEPVNVPVVSKTSLYIENQKLRKNVENLRCCHCSVHSATASHFSLARRTPHIAE